jgi:predicted DNA-binding protein
MALSVRLPEDVEARLDALARKTGARRPSMSGRRSSSTSKIKDYYLALERIQNTEGESLPLDDVITHLGLVDSV